MADETDLADVDSIAPRTGRVRRWALAGAGVVALVLGGVWGMRERIAADVIDRELASLGLPAHYRIESIGLGREVLGAVVVGDPSHPDLTIARVEIVLRYGLGRPAIERIVLVQPRLYGQLRDGRVHFGALDRGMFHTGLVPVANQEARAKAYHDYVLGAVKHPQFVGTHWFQWKDEPTTGRIHDEENYQIGFLDVADTPYRETIDASRTLAAEMYQARLGR